MATCDRCHRPVATTLNEAQQMAAGYCAVELLAGQPWGDVAADRCAAARDAWHVAEIARLTARVAELEAQVAANRWGRCACCAADTTRVAPVCADCVERSRWRRVEDELPPFSADEPSCDVWAVDDTGYGQRIADAYRSGSDDEGWAWFEDARDSAIEIDDGLTVTHWRPLPPPPKEAE